MSDDKLDLIGWVVTILTLAAGVAWAWATGTD